MLGVVLFESLTLILERETHPEGRTAKAHKEAEYNLVQPCDVPRRTQVDEVGRVEEEGLFRDERTVIVPEVGDGIELAAGGLLQRRNLI